MNSSARDYVFMWWRDGFGRGREQMNFQTGHYVMAADVAAGALCRLGAVREETNAESALRAGQEAVDRAEEVRTSLGVEIGGEYCEAEALEAIDFYGKHSRILESGVHVQRMDIMYYRFAKFPFLRGRLEILAYPRYAVLHFSLFSHEPVSGVRMRLGVFLPRESREEAPDGAVQTVRTGSGYVSFWAPETVQRSGTASQRFFVAETDLPADCFTGFGVCVMAHGAREEARQLGRENRVRVSAEAIAPATGALPVAFDGDRRFFAVDTSELTRLRNTDFALPQNRAHLERVVMRLENPTDQPVRVPLCFTKTGQFPITGLCPFLRDAQTGEPIGVRVQLSKNWHKLQSSNPADPTFYAAPNDPKRLLEGPWLHAYTLLTVEAHSTRSVEYTCTFAEWGGVYACSHAQLCLAGWGGNYQLWESSAIGSFGEAFCYDPETAHGRAFIDDIRPLNVFVRNDPNAPRYDWTGCNGGGNFLLYSDPAGRPVPLTRIRTYYRKQGPNLCEVIYTGVTADGAIEAELRAYLPRTNDCSRAIHRFSYRFVKDVAYSRLVLYQFGADHYNDNCWGGMAVGNAEGCAEFDLAGRHYSGVFAPPLPSGETGEYFGGAMQQAEIPGEGLWFGFFDAAIQDTNFCKNGPIANRLLNLLEFSGTLNGKPCRKPAFNLYGTVDFGVKCVACELTVPRCGVVRAGSELQGAVEYINLPVQKAYYYGPSEVMAGIPAEEFNTPALAMRYVRGGAVRVSAACGKVLSAYPVTVRADGNRAEITVRGGIAYVPLTFTGLTDYRGFRLARKEADGTFRPVDQSVYGNDYWQCFRSDSDGTYELTFNVPHTGDPQREYTYRLVCE